MLAIPITALSVVAIVLVAAAPSAAGGFDQCYYPCTARCAAKYACEHRNAELLHQLQQMQVLLLEGLSPVVPRTRSSHTQIGAT